MRKLSLLLAIAVCAFAQSPVKIEVNADQKVGTYKPIYAYFGYDEPNYTYMKNGQKLVGELAHLSASPVYIRTHFMLATGDGTPGLKWGSTNAYTEDASGKPVYDWTITDRIVDTYLRAGAKPFVEIGFMPQALSAKPDPYQPTWIPGGKNEQYSIGWSYPPRDYAKWGELVNQWVRHTVEKYGRAEVATWYWEVWNEPDISYWHGTPQEYDKLYDYAADGVKRAFPEAQVGGPASTGPAGERAANFLRQFLEHCSTGKNAATGATGAPLDFITYHAKGRPSVADGHVRMGLSKNAEDVDKGFQIVASFPKFRNLPIVLSESDPEGCAACSARLYPQNAYRNGALYPAYTAVMMKNIFELADREKTNIAGMLTWAFEFEGQPYFDGLRTLATNGIDKPVLNLFRMAGLMRGDRVQTTSSNAVALNAMLKDGVRGDPDIDGFAVSSDRDISVLAWNYHDDDVAGPDASIQLQISGVPAGVKRVLLHHYRIDATHSNAWTVWKAMGSPQSPTPEQYATLEQAGQLQELESPRWIDTTRRDAKLDFNLPRQGVSLVQLSW
ncbi:MAG: glycoside hydrolase, family 39 [Bryobacterales bacterium]|nr:glycoside hydrolase, family 39 [Bryobacterales bacterium]